MAEFYAYAQQAAKYPGARARSVAEDPHNPGTGCTLDGQKVDCAKLLRGLRNGSTRVEGIALPAGSFAGAGFVITRGQTINQSESDSQTRVWQDAYGIIDVGDVPDDPQTPTTTPTKTPCDVVLPNNPDARDAVRIAVHEHTSFGRLGKKQYDENGGSNGPEINWATLNNEAMGFIIATSNAALWYGKSVQSLIENTGYMKSQGATSEDNYQDAIKKTEEAQNSDINSDPCKYLKIASAIATQVFGSRAAYWNIGTVNQWIGRNGKPDSIHDNSVTVKYRRKVGRKIMDVKVQVPIFHVVRFGDTDFYNNPVLFGKPYPKP